MLPESFQQRFHSLCPAERLPAAWASFSQPKQVSFRLNALHPEANTALQQLLAAGLQLQPFEALAPLIQAFYCPAAQRELLTHHPCAESGQIYIQSIASMLAPWLLQPQTSDWVLDLAAAPGGKTSLLAAMMHNQGKISAVEPVRNRFFRMQQNLQRLHVSNTQLYLKDGRAVGKLKPETFDRVLLDAPCSSESRFRAQDPKSYTHWSLKKVKECAKKQKRLLLSAFDSLKPQGQLLYCTCAYAPEENEQVVDYLLKQRPSAHILPLQVPLPQAGPGLSEWQGKPFASDCALTCRLWPDQQVDGFYLALLGKA